LTQVHHSFLHRNNSPANHVARFMSRAGQFPCCNKLRAVLYCVQETGTRKKLLPDWPTHVQVSDTRRLTTGTSFWYKFLERVSPALRSGKPASLWLGMSQYSALWLTRISSVSHPSQLALQLKSTTSTCRCIRPSRIIIDHRLSGTRSISADEMHLTICVEWVADHFDLRLR